MNVTINPSIAKGTIEAPPSKSMAHRYLICAALSKGDSVISHIELSEDILATIDCIRALGADATVDGDKVYVKGAGSSLSINGKFMCRESGSTLRFFIPISMLVPGVKEFYGSKTLLKRPLSVYDDIAKEQGFSFDNDGECIKTSGVLKPGVYKVPGNISSQFITGLLYTLPLLSMDSTIELIPPVDSRSYIELTLKALNRFGVIASWTNDTTLSIKGNQKYTACDVYTEGDYSNAAFLDAFNLIGGDVNVTGLLNDSLQGDRVYREYFEALKNENATLDISDCPDLGPVLFAMAACLNGGTFTGTRRLKIKESDRGAVMCRELSKLGVRAENLEDSVIIYPGDISKPVDTIDGNNDHRIVMSMSLLLTKVGGEIAGAEAVKKSYPTFFEAIRKLGIEVTTHGMGE